MNEILLTSIKGIDHEIETRRCRLECRRRWYLDEFRDSHYSWKGFYLDGYKILIEIKKLNRIKEDLLKCDPGLVDFVIDQEIILLNFLYPPHDNESSQSVG